MFGKKDRKYWRKKALEATKLEKWADLLFCGEKMIELDQNDYDGWATKGDAHYNLGNYSSATIFYQKALKINTKDVLTWQNLGHSLKSQHKYKQAIRCYNFALDLNPLDRFHNNGKLRDFLIECEKLVK
jgi:tetratricopeptide (TPR) repeat protein